LGLVEKNLDEELEEGLDAHDLSVLVDGVRFLDAFDSYGFDGGIRAQRLYSQGNDSGRNFAALLEARFCGEEFVV
jgi:hypothetical protein